MCTDCRYVADQLEAIWAARLNQLKEQCKAELQRRVDQQREMEQKIVQYKAKIEKDERAWLDLKAAHHILADELHLAQSAHRNVAEELSVTKSTNESLKRRNATLQKDLEAIHHELWAARFTASSKQQQSDSAVHGPSALSTDSVPASASTALPNPASHASTRASNSARQEVEDILAGLNQAPPASAAASAKSAAQRIHESKHQSVGSQPGGSQAASGAACASLLPDPEERMRAYVDKLCREILGEVAECFRGGASAYKFLLPQGGAPDGWWIALLVALRTACAGQVSTITHSGSPTTSDRFLEFVSMPSAKRKERPPIAPEFVGCPKLPPPDASPCSVPYSA
jgi:hypothetical protein